MKTTVSSSVSLLPFSVSSSLVWERPITINALQKHDCPSSPEQMNTATALLSQGLCTLERDGETIGNGGSCGMFCLARVFLEGDCPSYMLVAPVIGPINRSKWQKLAILYHIMPWWVGPCATCHAQASPRHSTRVWHIFTLFNFWMGAHSSHLFYSSKWLVQIPCGTKTLIH